MNCWQFMKCGRERNGKNQHLLGTCPAYPKHGTHCARVAGTYCGGEVQGKFAEKLLSCMACDFYNSEHYDINYREVH